MTCKTIIVTPYPKRMTKRTYNQFSRLTEKYLRLLGIEIFLAMMLHNTQLPYTPNQIFSSSVTLHCSMQLVKFKIMLHYFFIHGGIL